MSVVPYSALALFVLSLAVVGSGCETIKEGDPCDDPGKYTCATSTVVFRCGSSDSKWHKEVDCDPGVCQTTDGDSNYSCVKDDNVAASDGSGSSDGGDGGDGADGGSSGVCSPGEERCSGNTVEYCSDGQWQALMECGDLTCSGSGSGTDCI